MLPNPKAERNHRPNHEPVIPQKVYESIDQAEYTAAYWVAVRVELEVVVVEEAVVGVAAVGAAPDLVGAVVLSEVVLVAPVLAASLYLGIYYNYYNYLDLFV